LNKEQLSEIIKEAILEEVEGEPAAEPAQKEDPEKRLAVFISKASGGRKFTGESQAEFLQLLDQISEVIRGLAKEKTGEEVSEGLQGAWVALEALEDSEIEARLPTPEPADDAEAPEGDEPAGDEPSGVSDDDRRRRRLAAAGVEDYERLS